MRYMYDVAGIKVLCEIPFALTIRGESEPFLQILEDEKEYESDLQLTFWPISKLPKPPEGGNWEICRYYVEIEDELFDYRFDSPEGTPYARVRRSGRRIICEYEKGKESYLNYSLNLCDVLGVERILLNHHGILLHASFIRYQDEAILFSAPSGTGKSTQADLWEKYKGAEIINGDRAGVRKTQDGIWKAFGLPYAGSSLVYKKEQVKIKAIVILRQGPENRIRRAGGAEAVRYLYPEITNHHWEREFVQQVMDNLTEVLSEVPVFYLECRPDREAVEVTAAAIAKMEEKEGEMP